MIPYEQARKLVIEKAAVLGQEAATLDEALGRVVARDIRSKINVPPFRNSAMDGYAVRCEDTKQVKAENYISLKLVAAQPAGDYFRKKIRSGETVKVMTGAPVPAGAEAVVPLEEVERRGSQILIKRQIKPGENIREAGEDVKAFLAEKEQEYTDKFANPYQAAQYGYIDDVIEPRNTRFRICRGLAQLATKRQSLPAKKHGCMPM